MNKNIKITELENEIKQKKSQLDKLKFHVDKSDVCSDLYNKVVLEKAILKKELQEMNNDTIANKVKKLVPHKKTLICDYFKGN